MKHTLFPIQYYHCKIHNHKELFGSLLDSAKHLLKDAQGKWNCSVYTTYFEEQLFEGVVIIDNRIKSHFVKIEGRLAT